MILTMRHRLDHAEEEEESSKLPPGHPADWRVRLTSPQRTCSIHEMLAALAPFRPPDALELELRRFIGLNVDSAFTSADLRGLKVRTCYACSIQCPG